MSYMLESLIPELAYKCDLCGELFNTPADAENHNHEAHTESGPNDEFGSWVIGTSAPTEDGKVLAQKGFRVGTLGAQTVGTNPVVKGCN